jgi:hypothetical protein
VTRAFWAALAVASTLAAPARAQDTQPLRLLIQVDTGAWRPSPLAPEDLPSDTYLRLRELRVGEELTGHDVHARILFEAQPVTATGQSYPALDGGRLPFGGPVRVTEVFAGWAPSRAFEVDAGSLRVPFSLSRQVDEADLVMPERPAFIQAYTPDFRTGASVGGDLGALIYRVAMLSADQTVDAHLFGRGYIAAGRIVAEPIGPVGLRPWRRGRDDPWFGWFRFAAGLSVLYGSLAAPQTLAIDPELTAQWRHLVVSAEYLLSMQLASGASFHDTGAQGVALEPGLAGAHGRRILVARGYWQSAGNTTLWAVGGAATLYAPDPRFRATVGFEERWSNVAPVSSYWAILRLTLSVD